MDARFQALAEERIHAAPLRYYLWLPLVRIADMWLRPRTELLPCDTRWWEFNDDLKWSVLALGLGALGVLYVATAFTGLMRHLEAHVDANRSPAHLCGSPIRFLREPGEPGTALHAGMLSRGVIVLAAAAVPREAGRCAGDSEMADGSGAGSEREAPGKEP